MRRVLSACLLALLGAIPLGALTTSAQAPVWPDTRIDRYSGEDDVVNIAFAATPPSGQTVTYSATNLPKGLSIDPQTGVVSGTLELSPAGQATGGAAGVHNVTITATATNGASSNYSFTWRVSRFKTGDVFAGIGNGTYRVFSDQGVFKYDLTVETAGDFNDTTGLNYGWGGGTTTGCGFNWTTRKMYFTQFDDDYDPTVAEIDPVPVGGAFTRSPLIRTFRDAGYERDGVPNGFPIDGGPESVVFGTDFGPDGVLGTEDDVPGTMYIGHALGYYSPNPNLGPDFAEINADINDRAIISTDDWFFFYYVDANGDPILDENGNRIPYAQGVSTTGLLMKWPGLNWTRQGGGTISPLVQWGRDIQKWLPNGSGWTRAVPDPDNAPRVEGYDTHSGWQGSDWLDLAVDQRTIYYTSEWGTIYRYDVGPNPPGGVRQLAQAPANPDPDAPKIWPYVQLPVTDPSNPRPRVLYALRVLPPGDGSGGVLVAQTEGLLRINANGVLLNQYDAAVDGFFALNISPDGKSVWSASTQNGRIYRWKIASAERESLLNGGMNGFDSGASTDDQGRYRIDGLCVMGEYTAAQEICGDGIDNDEDGEIDEICQPLEACHELSPGDDDGDGLVDSNDPDCPSTTNVCAATGYTDASVAGYCARFNREGDNVSLLPAPGPAGQLGLYETYRVSGLPPGITASASGVLSGVPEYSIRKNTDNPDTTTYTVQYEVERRRVSGDTLVAEFDHTFEWTIQNVNQPPVAADFATTLRPGQTATFELSNQTGVTSSEPCAAPGPVDPDCEDTVSVTSTTSPAAGTLSAAGNVYTWTPPANDFTGVATYQYTISDGRGGTDTGTVTITVINTPPVANDDAVTTRPGVSIGIAVIGNDTDADAPPTPQSPDTLTVTTNTNPSNGTLTRTGNLFTYTPNTSFTGVDTFTYTITDGWGGFDTATVTITVNNNPPVAVDDFVGPIQAGPTAGASFNVLTMGTPDSDPDGDTLTLTTFTQPSAGTLTRTSGGNFTWVAPPGYSGVTTFTYTITDGFGGFDTATVTITVRNQPPVAVNDTATTKGTQPVAIPVLTNDSDPDNHAISITGATTPGNGTAVVNVNGTITYTANPGFQGTDTFFYTIRDGYGGESTAMVTVTIGPPNRFDPCLCASATASPSEIWPPNHKKTQVVTITNLTDPDGGALDIKILGIYQDEPTNYLGDGTTTIDAGGVGTSEAWVRAERTGNPNVPGNGRVYEIVFEATAADGSSCRGSVFTGVPHDQGNGNTIVDDGIRYDSTVAGGPIVRQALDVRDGLSDEDVAGMSFEQKFVGRAQIGDRQNKSSYSGWEAVLCAWFGGCPPLQPELAIGPTTDDIVDTEHFTWTSGQPATFLMWNLGDQVHFKLITDSQFEYVTYNVDCANGECDDIVIRAQTGGAGTIRLSSMNLNGLPISETIEIASDGDPESIHLSGLSLGEGFTLTGQVTVTWTGTPDPDALRFDVAVGSACPTDDDGGGSDETPPIARSDSYATNEDTPLVVSAATGILVNDLTFAGPLTASLVTTTTNGTLALNDDGSFTYTPAPNFTGQDTFTYHVSDGSLSSEPALVTITVTPIVDPPVAVDDSATTNENTPVTIAVTANDSDPLGGTLSVTSLTQPSNGTAVISGTSVIYTPLTGFIGIDTFTYTVTGTEGTATATVTVTVLDVNEPPVAVNNSYTTAEDTPLTIAAPGVLGNDSDPDTGDTLTAVLVTGPSNGTVTQNADGSFVYTPAANYNGLDSYTYRVRDAGGLESNVAVVSITITPVADPPVAVDDSYVATEDTVLTIASPGVKDNDTDPDTPKGELTVSLVTGAQRGSLTLNADGSFIYTPFPDVSGSDTFVYALTDGTGTSNATVTIAITESPDPPVALDDAATTPEDTPVEINILGNDSDPDTENLTITAVTQGANGSVVITGGAVTYTPAPDFYGTDTFTYTISDGTSTATATVTVTVTAVNDVPVAVPDTYTTPRNTPLTVPAPGVLANDSDSDEGQSITAIIVTQPGNGSVTLQADGSFVYTPSEGFVGTDTYTYKVNDGEDDSNTTTVTITVTAVNAPPVAVGDTATTESGTPVTIEVVDNDSDPDGDDFEVTAHTSPSNGTVTRTGDRFVYTPNANFTGTDTFTYTITDEHGATATATVTIVVSEVCETTSLPGAIVRKTTMFDAGGRVEGSIQVTGGYNATFNSNTTLTGDLYIVGTPQIQINGTPAAYGGAINGSGSSSPTSHRVTINAGASLGRIVRRTPPVSLPGVSNPPSPTGTRNVVMNGPGDSTGSFTTIKNLTLNSNVGPVTVPPGTYGDFIAGPNSSFVIGEPGATTPSVYNFQRLTLNAGSSALTVVGPVIVTVRYGATFHGPMGSATNPDWLTLRVASQNVQLDSQMQFYGYLLAPESQLIVNAGTLLQGGFGVEYFTINSNGRVVLAGQSCQPSEPPVASNDAYSTTEDTPLTIAVPGVLTNDSDPNGAPLTASLVNPPPNGTVTLNGTGSFVYTPAADYTGTDVFTYRVSNGSAFSNTATVTITITDTPDPPDAVNDTATTSEDTPVTINVLSNDTDPDSTTLTVQSVTQPSHGTVTIVSGQVRYTPAPNYNGPDSFTYTITDGTSTDTATVTITVTSVNDPPSAVNDSYTTTQNTVLNQTTSVLINDSDPEGEALTARLVTSPTSGSVVFQTNGTFAYTPANNFTGTATFTYRANDGTGDSNIATVTIVVTAANRPPVAANDSYSTDKNKTLTVNAPGIMSNDSDPDQGNTITAHLISAPPSSAGSLTLNANGSFTFVPANNYSGTTTFRYRVRDNHGAESNEAIVTIEVRNVTTSGRVCYDGGSNKTAYTAWIDWTTLDSGDIQAIAYVSRNYADNTYGVNRIGWGKPHDFKHLYTSDFAQLAFYDTNGSKKIDFKIDYLSPKSGTPSGYGTMGVSSGKQADGGMVSGSASDIVYITTSIDLNMNAFGYVSSSSNHPLKSYSPPTNSSYVTNASYPNWIWDVAYLAIVKKSTFGSAGFGTVTLRNLHASPAKEDISSWRLINCQ